LASEKDEIKEVLEDALQNCGHLDGVIVLGIHRSGASIYESSLTPANLCFLKEILSGHIRDVFEGNSVWTYQGCF
jgi:hypothetical protein